MVKFIQNAFTRGQIDYSLLCRDDIQAYRKGASKISNFIVKRHGGIEKRHGFDRMVDLTASPIGLSAGAKTRLVPFAYTKKHGFVIMFTNGHTYAISTDIYNGGTIKCVEVKDSNNMSSPYNETDISKIDYQQSGDELFIASENHPPARIIHSRVGGIDSFRYEVCNFTIQKDGIPSIVGATVLREGVACSGGTKTESYKVSAIYDGMETLPSSEYKDEYVGKNTSTAKSWSGTSYYMPWTESQTITLKISIPERNGKKPDKILVYRKNFNYFGLIGCVNVKNENKRIACGVNASEWGSAKYNDTGSSDFSINADIPNEDANERGKGRTGYTLGDTVRNITITSSKQAKLTIWIGKVSIDTSTSGQTTFSYNGGSKIGSVKIYAKLANGAWKDVIVPKRSAVASETIYSQSAEDIENGRASFAAKISEASSISFDLTSNTDSQSIDIKTASSTIVINKIMVESESEQAVFVDKYYTPDSSVTPLDEGDDEIFSGTGNYPSAVSMSQQRLVWASSKNDPARVWMSQTGDLYNYYQHEIMKSDDAIDFIMPITRFAKINHIAEMRKLLMFNSACEWLVDSSSSTSGITYATIQAYPQSYSGSDEKMKPLICNNMVMFPSRNCQEIRRFAWDLANDGFAGKDVSIFAGDIFRNNSIVDWTYQQFPNSTIWMVLADGSMASLTYMEEQDILAWATHTIGGGGEVKAIATTYASATHVDEIVDSASRDNSSAYTNASSDEIFAVVKRDNKLWLERMRVQSKDYDSVYHQIRMDSLRKCTSTAQLSDENNMCYIKQGNPFISTTKNEAISYIQGGGTIYEGYRFSSELVTVPPIIGNDIWNGRFDVKNIRCVNLMLGPSYEGRIMSYASDEDYDTHNRYEDIRNLNVDLIRGNIMLGKASIHNLKPAGVNTRDGRLKIMQDEAWPFAVNSIETEIDVEEDQR